MRLWLQVLFAQGYLWREQSPQFWSARDSGKWSPHGFDMLRAVAFSGIGVFLAIIGSAVYGLVIAIAGAAMAIAHGDSFGLKRFFGSRAFWLSVNWAAGTLALGGLAAVLVLSVAFGIWRVAAPVFLFWVFAGTEMLRDMQRHYLFFAGRRQYIDPPGGESDDRSDLYVETYWLLPREIFFGIEAPRRPPKGGTV